ncbi:metal cation symporter ZIP8-like [Plectropomus leopardus]|uniref:metal cation symporter ZIP8-like n=1 Tax=Plectropomus leopardus TaxID=160734 RepID=UPI001C4BE7DE|nr:metal cation symporter ZIP8-like [Plectropomus leopardus]
MFHLKCVITWCVLVSVPICESLNAADRDGHAFLQHILRFYGENNSISTENLEDLLLLMSERRPAAISAGDALSDQECPSAEQILSHFGFSNVSQLTVGHLGRICPAVLTQVLLPSCPYTAPKALQPPDYSGLKLRDDVASDETVHSSVPKGSSPGTGVQWRGVQWRCPQAPPPPLNA